MLIFYFNDNRIGKVRKYRCPLIIYEILTQCWLDVQQIPAYEAMTARDFLRICQKYLCRMCTNEIEQTYSY
jgi:hypothetical protein